MGKKAVQVIPHITNEIKVKSFTVLANTQDTDIVITEIGGNSR